MPNQDPNSKQNGALSNYRPVRTGWQRTEELQDEELEQRGKAGIVVAAILILILILLYAFRRA
jgi:hypothetical protein